MKIRFTTRELTVSAVLSALNILITKFVTLGPHIYSINLGFVALICAGYFLGPLRMVLFCLVANVISNVIFNSGTPYSFIFLLPSAIAGLTYGMLYYNKSLISSLLVNTVVVVGISFLLQTAVLSYTLHRPYFELLSLRIPRTIAMLIVYNVVGYLILQQPIIERFRKQIQ